MNSPLFEKYHNFVVNQLPLQPEVPIPELQAGHFTREDVVELSKGFTFPIVIRGAGKDAESVKHWNSKEWWLEHYPDEEVLCGYITRDSPFCTIREFFEGMDKGESVYISGGSSIFSRNPELRAMVDTKEVMDLIEPEGCNRTATQIFMGLKDMGSDLHAALGCNVFRQVAGQKKWWFIPPSQTPYVWPSINTNSFSAHTKTMVGIEDAEESAWLNRIKRFTAVLNPGDVLINPPWFWHAIKNQAEEGELVIGVPTRYIGPLCNKAAMNSNRLFTMNTMLTLIREYGSMQKYREMQSDELIEGRDTLERNIAKNREVREVQDLKYKNDA